MAAQKATEVRGVTLEPTDVAVIGVAETPVPSSGETTVSIDMGGGVIVNERVAVVPHLPGQADVLVSFDTLKDVGLEICKEKILVEGQQVKLVEQAAPSREGAPGVRAAEKWEPTSEDRLIKDQLKEERRIVHELHQKVSTPEGPRHPRYGPRQVTFEQMWQENSVEEVGRDSEGRPWFKPALGATEQPLLDRSPRRQKKPMKSKKALPAVKSRKVDKRRIKQQRLNLEFAALETTLEEAIQLREEAEANQEFDSMIDRATRGYETAKNLQTESWKSVAASVVQKVVGLAEAPNSQTGPSRFVVAATAVAATEAPKTVRAAEVIERYAKTGEWVRADTEDLLGPEQLPEIVDVDEYCMPNPPDPVKRAEMEAEFEKIIAKSNYSESSKEEYRRIIREHGEPYLLQLEPQDVGKLKKTPLRIRVDPSVPPQRDKRRTQTPENDQWLKEWFTKSDQLGITFKPSPEQEHRVWVANPLVVTQVKPVTKKVEKRLCVDYWMVNKHVQLGPQRVPLMSEFADRVHGAVLLDGDDGFSGYYQYPLDEDSRLLTGVWTPLGIRCFSSMPMGISPAPEKWNTAMAEVFADLPTNRFFQYMDDFFRFTGNETGDKTREQIEREHLELFRQFLIRCKAGNLKLKLVKAMHGVEEVNALGQMYGHGERWKTDYTTEVINNYPTPTSGKQLERFLSLGNYYSDYVDDYSGRVTRLRALARKHRWGQNDFVEGSVERNDFEAIRLALVEQTRLALPNWNREFIVKSDWSKQAMGAALLQRDDSGRLRPVLFCSRKCTDAEGKVGAPDGEMLALVNAIKKFEKYLQGRKFSAFVDQGSLGWLKERALSSVNNRRLQAAFAYLRQFHFELFYRPSKEMQDVDALSRATILAQASTDNPDGPVIVEVHSHPSWEAVCGANATPAGPVIYKKNDEGDPKDELPLPAQVELEGVWGFDTDMKSLGEQQLIDDEVIAIRKLMAGRALQDLELVPTARRALSQYLSRDPACTEFVEGDDGRLYHLDTRKGKPVRQLVVPLACRGRLVVMKHAMQGHKGAEEVLEKLKKHYFWPSMRADVMAWIGGCGCQKKKAERQRPVGRLHSLKVQRPGQKVLFDIFGPLPPSLSGNIYVLVMMDVGTREVMLEALPNKEAKGIARALFERIYLRGMCPEVWQSDLAKEFVSQVMQELAQVLGAEFRHSSPYRPQTNTHVERFNKTLATQLSLMLKRPDQRDWDQYLKHVEYAQLVGAQRALGRFSPLFLRGGWEALDPIDVAMEVHTVKTQDKEVGEWMADLQRARQIAMESQELALTRQADAEGRKRIIKRDVDIDDVVWVMFPNVGPGKSKKLAFRMHGPYVLKRWLHGGRRVAVLGHETEPADEIVAHVDRMVRKKDVPEQLRKQWKPLKLELAVPEKRNAAARLKAQEDVMQVRSNKPQDVQKDLAHGLEDRELEFDHIVSKHFVLDEEGRDGWQYRVRFVGYEADEDEWYWEEDLKQTAPQAVEEFNKLWDKDPHKAGAASNAAVMSKRGSGKSVRTGRKGK